MNARRNLYYKAKRLGYNGKWTVTTQTFIDYINDYRDDNSIEKNLNSNISFEENNDNIIDQNMASQNEIQSFLLNKIANTSIRLTAEQLYCNVNLMEMSPNKLLLITIIRNGTQVSKYLTNYKELKNIIDNIKYGELVNSNEIHGSDVEITQEAYLYNDLIKLTWHDRDDLRRSYNKKSGSYFPYYHTLEKIDLSRYQIYREYQKDQDQTACLLFALEKAGIDEYELNKIRSMLVQKNLSINELSSIAKILNITINLTSYDSKRAKRENKIQRYQVFNKDSPNQINIGLIESHYFINEQTNITKYAITNYNDCKEHRLFPSCAFDCNIRMANAKYPCLMSFDVIVNLIKHTKLIPITIANVTNTTEKLMDYTELRNPRSCCSDMFCQCDNSKFNEYKSYSNMSSKQVFKGCYKNNNPNDDYDIIFADFETFQGSLGYHIPYCLSYKKNNESIKSIYGLNCSKEFLDTLTKSSVIITHNLSFDFKMMQDHLTNMQSCIETGTKLKTITANYNKNKIVFKDNYAFLSYKLSQLPSMFKLDCGMKDEYPYSLINDNNYNKIISLSKCLEHVNNKELFIANAKKLNCLTGNFVDIEKYTKFYCEQDVRILSDAYTKLREQILEISDSKLDIIKYISLPQLSDDFFRMRGCYDGCYKINGIAHDFIRRCVVGGRVMCAFNEKSHQYGLIQDFDAVSLYPSAMARLSGYIKGLPKVIDIFEPSNYDHYFIEIRVNSIGINRAFPLVSIKDENDIHNFTNDLIGKNIYVDKFTLEDLIKWQDIKYTFIRGYYFDDGFNPKIIDVIREIFNKRVELKKAGNPLQETYKLIMNSSYGKLCQKPIKRNIVFKNGTVESNMNYLINNYENIVEFVVINPNLIKIVTQKSIVNHFAPVHMAVQVLSMSKRIMNEVMCLAEDNNINIYYQDTDSMHIDESSITKLSDLFQNKYNRNLIGKDMGQFHSDFSVNDSQAKNIVAIESIFLGKKCYIDKLQYEINGSIGIDYHIRMKSIPTQCIKDYDSDYMKTFESLYNSKEIEFILDKYCPLQKTKDLKMINTRNFSRKIKFS